MNLTTAQHVAAAISDAGGEAIIRPMVDSGSIVGWEVQANAVLSDLTVNQAKNLQDATLVVASVRTVIFR